MTAAPRRWAAELLHAWFYTLRPVNWWVKSPAVDAMLSRRFRRELETLGARQAREFLRDPLTARAAVLLFDQIPRNLYRGDARAWACDSLARELTRGILARGWDRHLPDQARQFIYMPLMHSEAIADQRDSLRLFAKLHSRYGMAFARSHHRVIARFGRFPHRNQALGRHSTAAERRAVASGAAW